MAGDRWDRPPHRSQRFDVLPDLRKVPSEAETKARFMSAVLRMKRNPSPADDGWIISPNWQSKRRTEDLALRAHERHLRETGLAQLDDRQARMLRPLIRNGAALAGPSAPHAIDELFAALHAESPWMAPIGTAMMTAMHGVHARARSGANAFLRWGDRAG